MRYPLLLPALLLLAACRAPAPGTVRAGRTQRLPTGVTLDPAGVTREVGQMPLAMLAAPDGRRVVMLLNGYREQGLQVVDRAGTVVQSLPQEAAFIGLAFAPDGRTLYASGGNQDVVYRYAWQDDMAVPRDSLILARRQPDRGGTRYPAGLALSPDGTRLYVTENLADSLAVVDLATGAVVQRVATGLYPYGVAVTPEGTVFVSNWDANVLSVFTPGAAGRLVPADPIAAGRHASALLLNASGSRLFVTSGSTDRVAVVDTRARRVVATLLDPPPSGPDEGTTPNALALSADGTTLFVAEADANAVAVFDLSAATSDVATARGDDLLAGRIPVGWYPTSLLALGDTLFVANGKGAGTGPNPRQPQPGTPRSRAAADAAFQYTLGQIRGSLSIIPAPPAGSPELQRFSERVVRANGWDRGASASHYPPFRHVIYIIRENRSYDQVLGDVVSGDGDTSLLFFGRDVTPNAHALARRFGLFDRFFVNAEVSADGHNWSMAGYATDYVQKVAPTSYSGDGRDYDYEGTNRGKTPADNVSSPAQGYLFDLAARAHLTYRNFGEMTAEEGEGGARRYRGTFPFQAANTDSLYPAFDLQIPDQRRADVWLEQFRRWVAERGMPVLQTLHLPRDHTAGAAQGYATPKAMAADNDLALGRIVEAVTRSPFWPSTVIFVLEDDAQNGPDHVDSHRSVLLAISAWNRRGVYHRFTNTTDVLRTIEEILGLGSLSQFDNFGRPLREIWADIPDTSAYGALTPAQRLDEMNPARTRGAIESRRLDLVRADAADMELFNHLLWRAVKGDAVPYPGARRMSVLEARRAR